MQNLHLLLACTMKSVNDENSIFIIVEQYQYINMLRFQKILFDNEFQVI